MGNLRKFIYLSIAVHLLALAFIYLAPTKAAQEAPAGPYVVRLMEPPPAPPPPPEKQPEAKPPKQRAVKPPPARPPEPAVKLPKFKEPPNALWKESGPKATLPETARKEPGKAGPEKPGGPEGKTAAGETPSPEKAQPSAEGTLSGGQKGESRASKGPGGESEKDKLFDRDIIAMLARKREPPPPSDGITFDTREFRYRSYMLRLKERIEGIWKYPPEAAQRGIYGDLYIRFVIMKNGKLESAEVLRTSGIKMLDDAALRALRDGEPYWPLPEDWQEDSLTITGHFVYSLWGSYVR